MKHLKLFEEVNSKYQVGDYIEFIDKDKIRNNTITEESIVSWGKVTKVEKLDVIYYQVMMNDRFYTTVSQNENLITRKLTDEEIIQFESEIEAEKYNL